MLTCSSNVAKDTCASYLGYPINQNKVTEDNEIPIWIRGEPRFISGIMSSTTCYELIQALIDDELHDKRNEEANVDVAVSRDLNDYVITECWRDVEQALTGETYILPLWQAWSTARNEIKFKLKINKNKAGHANEYKKPDVVKSKKRKFVALRKLIKRLIYQSETIHDHLSVISDNQLEKKVNDKRDNKLYDTKVMANFLKDADSTLKDIKTENIYVNPYTSEPNPIDVDQSDELFLLIDNCNDDGDSGVHVEYGQYVLNQKCNASMRAKLCRNDAYQETPKRKLYSKKQKEKLRKNNLNARLSTHEIPTTGYYADVEKSRSRYEIIRLEVLCRISDMKGLLRKENDLVSKLAKRCAQYRSQNQIYTAKIGLEMEIEQVQANLSYFAEEIIRNEVELFKKRKQFTNALEV
ncbi:Ras association domain-containing protein 10 [Pseudolycoriella hygida]|uniref:Ras association domain-containing protein 10 n=1 Tax=Pseudolycoriella hygida TaxID=35572 RepID=A0A9Q0N6P2_9DIPT|nr:Ras association domain-containing protein 10 [Pseudolycoriella hygida]